MRFPVANEESSAGRVAVALSRTVPDARVALAGAPAKSRTALLSSATSMAATQAWKRADFIYGSLSWTVVFGHADTRGELRNCRAGWRNGSGEVVRDPAQGGDGLVVAVL